MAHIMQPWEPIRKLENHSSWAKNLLMIWGLAKQNIEPCILVCEETMLKMVNDRNIATVPVFNAMFDRSNMVAKLRYNCRGAWRKALSDFW